MKELIFYDLKNKKKFKSTKYEYISKRNPKTGKTVYMARCKAPSGIESYRIIAKEEYKK